MKTTTKTLLLLATTSGFAHAGLIAHYTFDEADTGIADSVGGNSNSTAINSSTGGHSGKVGGAWQLNGDNGIAIDASSGELTGLTSTTGFTIAGWVKTSNNLATIFSISDNTTGSEELAFRASDFGSPDGRLDVLGRDGTNTDLDSGVALSTTLINDNVWHHVAVTIDSAGFKLYVDGVQEDSGTQTVSPGGFGANVINFGSNDDSNGGGNQWPLTGQLDEWRIYDNVESASNIAALAAVPEPSSAALLGLGGLALILRRRK